MLQGTSLQNKQGEQDEEYYRSLGKLAYKNMGLGGASIYIYISRERERERERDIIYCLIFIV